MLSCLLRHMPCRIQAVLLPTPCPLDSCPAACLQESVHDAFVGALLQEVGHLRLGNGLDPGTTQGPLISSAAVGRVRASSVSWASVEDGERGMVGPAGLASCGAWLGVSSRLSTS